MYKYTEAPNCDILKDGHTMFSHDIVADLNRKSYLEEKVLELESTIESMEYEILAYAQSMDTPE